MPEPDTSPTDLLAAHGATLATIALGDLQFVVRHLGVLRAAAMETAFQVARERIDSGAPLFVDGSGAQLVAELLQLITDTAAIAGSFAAELAPMAERLQIGESLAQRERTGAALH